MARLRGDHFGVWLAAIVILCAPLRAWARADLALGASVRSYPLAGVLETEAGYGILLWGQNGRGPWYGYLRPRFDGASAVRFNSGQVALELFPISFLGVRAGGESIQNDLEYSAYACERLTCLGRFYRTFAEVELTLGAGPVFVQGRARRERWTASNTRVGEFVDPTSGLLMRADGESQTVYTSVLGVRFGAQWTLMGFLRYAESDREGLSRFPFAVLRYRSGRLSIGVGGGAFESTLKRQEASAVGFLRWEIAPSVALN